MATGWPLPRSGSARGCTPMRSRLPGSAPQGRLGGSRSRTDVGLLSERSTTPSTAPVRRRGRLGADGGWKDVPAHPHVKRRRRKARTRGEETHQRRAAARTTGIRDARWSSEYFALREARVREDRQPIATVPSLAMRHEGLWAISQMMPFGSCTCAW